MRKEIDNKIYVIRINGRDKNYCRNLEVAQRKMEELKRYYKGRMCEILKETDLSFEAYLGGWDAIHNYIDIKEIEVED